MKNSLKTNKTVSVNSINADVWAARTAMLAAVMVTTPVAAQANTGAGASAQSEVVFVPGTGNFDMYIPESTTAPGARISRPVVRAPAPVAAPVSRRDPGTSRLAIAAANASAPAEVERNYETYTQRNRAETAPVEAASQAAAYAPAQNTIAAPTDTASDTAQEAQDEFNIRFRADTLVINPVLNVGLVESERTATAGENVTFLGYNNYPAFVEKSEVRVFRASQNSDSNPLAVIPADDAGAARWTVPQTGPSAMFYVYRVYGTDGKFDDTKPQELTIVDKALANKQPVARPNFGKIDEAARRNINLEGIMATVTGVASQQGDVVKVSGQYVPVDNDGKFVSQQIIPRDKAGMVVAVERGGREVKRVNQSFAVPKDDWFVVGQGDLTLGKSFSSGPAEQVSGDSLAQGSYAIGRAAFYAKGVVGDDVRVTASVDTGETLVKDLFSNLDRKDPSQLLRRLNREQYYPTYGDDSTLVEDAPTQGRFYLRVNKDDSQFVLGNFVTQINGAELAQLDRGLFGALIDVKSADTTSFGERKSQITAFASDPGTVPGREEFRGTGGSLYFLKRQDVSAGSERLRIEVRDRETGLVLESRDLYAQQDYDFDPFQGRITLLKPLASTVASGGTVREGSSTGNVPVLVARYEYSPPVGSLDGYTVGGRASGWLGDKLRFGVTAQRDTVEEAAQTLIGADVTFRATAGTYVKAEIAQSDGPGFGQSNSVDGGLSFTDIANPGSAGKAKAWRTEAAINFAELAGKSGNTGTLSAYYENYDRGFASAGRLTPEDTTRWGAAAAVPIGSSTKVVAKYDELTSSGTGSSKTGTFDLEQGFGDINAKVGLRYEDRTPGLLNNTVQDGSRTDAAVELEYAPAGKNWSAYAFGQATIDRDATRSRNNRGGVGTKVELSEKMSLAAEVSEGDGGLGADVQLNTRIGDGMEAYVGYALFADRTDTGLDSQNIFTRSNRGTLTVGAKQRFSDSLSIYGESRSGFGGTAPSLTRSFGLKFDPTEKLSFGGSFENGRIDDASTGPFRRTAGSVNFGYVDDGVRLGSSVEVRKEKGALQNQTVWLLRNDLSYKVNPDFTGLLRFNVARANNDSSSIRAAEFVEAIGGLAYRPVNNERLNALLRFNYFEDLGPAGQVTGSGQTESPKQISKIVSLDVNYDLTKKLTIGAKYGYRGGKVSLGRNSDEFVSSNAHLAVIRADYNIMKKWDITAEGRALWATAADDKRFGALGAIYRHLGNNVKVGVGYSLSDFSDDLTDQSYSSHGPFLNILGKF